MAGNPRKFSEKIAIQQRKLNEEQNAFENIIAEVSRITRGDENIVEAPNLCPPGGWPRPGGSLPNVCHLSQQPQMMSPVDPMTLYAGHWPGSSGGHDSRVTMVHPRERSPGAGTYGHHTHIYHPYRPVSPQNISPRTVSPSRQLSPDLGQQMPPQQFGAPHAYLVPPQDTTWRRTHSDPGIHASVMQPNIMSIQHSGNPISMATPSGSGVAPSNNLPAGDLSQAYVPTSCYLDPKGGMNAALRPRSCETVPQGPSVNVQPSEPVVGQQISISNNSGSLPDLPSSVLPLQGQAHKMEDLIRSQPPPLYSHASIYAASSQPNPAAPAPVANVLQQRHSIQLPVQYSQGSVSGTQKYFADTGYQNFGSHNQSYQPESPRSTSGSPNDVIPGGQQLDSSATSPQAGQPQSPGSAYYSLQTQMQSINIDSQNQQAFTTQQQDYYGGSYYGSLPASTPYQSYAATTTGAGFSQTQMSQQQVYQALMMQQQQQYQHDQMNAGLQQQAPLSPQSGQIPNIIFTGTDGSVCGGGASRNVNGSGLYVDSAVELLSSDLRMSLDPVDLECLHGLGTEEGLSIDAASEDELRRDRI